MIVSVVKETARRDATYNISVADFHTYFVGEQRVLVHNCNVTALKDGDKLSTDDALDAAQDFLGPNQRHIGEAGSGITRSADGTRQVRMGDSDLAKTNNHHPEGPHMNFETGTTKTKPNGKETFERTDNKNIILPEER